MKTIGEQINTFLAESGRRATEIAKESGIADAFISRLRFGKQKDIYASKADAIRAAMRRLDPVAAEKALEDGE